MIVARAAELKLRSVLARDEMIIAVGEGELRGDVLACALHSDWLVLAADAEIIVDTPHAWSGVVWRMGRQALPLLLGADRNVCSPRGAQTFLSAPALADALVPAGRDPLEWTEEWVGARSTLALDAAAGLIRRRGGDVLERAEFARLFAAGEPQRGLAAFLNRRMRRDR